jgi:AcrR family transcriptional regulator
VSHLLAPGRREERKAQNRAKLLDAARRVFSEKGLGAATVRDIVRETDLATGTFYNYFEDKEEVFRALLEEFSAKARAAVREQRKLPGSLEERVENAYRAYFEIVLEERELFEMLRRNAGAIALMTGEGLFEAGVRELFEDLREWAEDGDLPPLDLDYLATAGVAIGFQLATHLIDRDPPDAEGAARFCARVFLGGIRALAEEDVG